MTDPHYPPAYGFGLAKISGVAGAFIWLGQLLAGRPSRWQHAFLVLPNDTIIEAEPGGARLTSLNEYWDSSKQRWNAQFVYPPLTADQRAKFEEVARSYAGIPYGWFDYVSLLLVHLHIRLPFVKNFILNSRTVICSQLVDGVYQSLGVQLFNDGRFPGDVMPADLDWAARHHPAWTVSLYHTNLESR